jgi:hypothetical protein
VKAVAEAFGEREHSLAVAVSASVEGAVGAQLERLTQRVAALEAALAHAGIAVPDDTH